MGYSGHHAFGRVERAFQVLFACVIGMGCRYWGESGQNQRQRRRNRDRPSVGSDARIMTTPVNALEQRGGRYGLQTMCEGERLG
jgi:hypothetical protein